MADARSSIADRYATALFELSLESQALEAVENDLRALKAAMADSADLKTLVASPAFDADAKAAAIGAVLSSANANPLTQNFVQLLAKNGRLAVLPMVVTRFEDLAATHRGEVTAEAVTARALTAEQEKDLRAQIEAAEGKAVSLKTSVDPTLLGGMIVKVGSRMIDASLRTKLNRLRQTLKEA